MFDVGRIRKEFPILQRTVHGKPLVYLDNAATSQKPAAVIDALVEYYERYNANIHRGLHTLAEEATNRYEEAREKVRRFINAPGCESIIFTRNATESINLVAHSWGRANVHAGDEIVLTVMEHHSNLVPWQMLAKETGASLRFVDVDDEGRLRREDWQQLIGEKTRLVAVTQMSNVLGTINPVREIVDLAHQFGALVLVDGAQSVAHMPVDVLGLDCDFLIISGHKMLGPTGVGVLYARRRILDEMAPFLTGGHMISKVSLEDTVWNEVPWRFEAGTANIADVIAYGAAIDYLEGIGMEAVRRHDIELTSYALEVLGKIPNLTLYGPPDASDRGAAVSFNVGNLHPHDIGTVLDSQGVAIRAGHHCAQPLMTRLGVPATARASFQIYNRREEIDILAEGIQEAARFFGDAIGTRT
ncbi:MAG TPA: cysteine desulfurase [Dehalococcoidia bacterium]|nr:cysteine desulfurase [Dehalococcoidia bacterium]